MYGPAGIFTFRIQGELCHRISSLLPGPDRDPCFSQIYIYDSDPQRQAGLRMGYQHGRLDENTVLALQDMLRIHNPYTAVYRMAKERLDAEEHISL